MNNEVNKKKRIIEVILFVIYLIFNGVLLLNHEQWRDEANAWLIARDMSPIQLFWEIKYQGHPWLWYLFLMPFAKLGFPFEMISWLSFLIMAVVAWIFVFKAPFHPITKIICLISPIFSYYYPVVARSYCIIALVLILLAYLYPKRNERSILYGFLLGLALQADTIAIATVGLISCMWLWECICKSVKEKTVKPLGQGAKGLWIPLASLIVWFIQFSGVSDSPLYNMRDMSIQDMVREMKDFLFHILTRMTGGTREFDILLIVIFLLAAISFSIVLKSVWPMIVTLGTFAFYLVFSVLLYQLHIWHYIMLCYVLIWFFWLGRDGEKPKQVARAGRILAEGFLVVLGVTMFMRWNSPEESSSLNNAWNGIYSDGVNVAKYMEEYVGEEELIISSDVTEAVTVQAYLKGNYSFYFAGNGKVETYADYLADQKNIVSYEELIDWITSTFPEKEYFYLLLSPQNYISDIDDSEKNKWELCYQTKEETGRNEEYSLYKIMLD